MKRIVISSLVAAILVSGCQSTLNNRDKGAIIGAGVGALLGKATGDNDKSRYAWGAVVGALAGGAIGHYMDEQERQFRESLRGSGVKIYREGENLRLQLPGNVTFRTGDASVSPGFHPVLSDVARVLNRYEKTYLVVEGHTDSVGDAGFNQSLSESRANAVQRYLLSQQVDGRRVGTVGFGESAPLYDNTSAENRQLNRRVELRILPNKAS